MVDTAMDINPTYLNDPFTNVTIDRAIKGGTTVYWELTESFSDATPWEFTLQWSRSGDDWIDVGTTGNFALSDTSQRDFDIVRDSFWQVKLVTGNDTYYSGPASMPDSWNVADLRRYNEARRQANRMHAYKGVGGWILFKKNWGSRCTDCIDVNTHEVTNSDCTSCYGTGFEGGYYPPFPMDCLFLGEKTEHVNTGKGDDVVEKANIRVAVTPMIQKNDVVILDSSDKRYKVEKQEVKAHIKGYPAVEVLVLNSLPPQDIIYDMTWSGSSDPANGEQEW